MTAEEALVAAIGELGHDCDEVPGGDVAAGHGQQNAQQIVGSWQRDGC